jgi:predicted Zn finger-like uncharacterized protein
MYSQCPDCQTRFRVTAAALRAARGTVRCGRCGSAFDALERLSDSAPAAPAEAPAVPVLLSTGEAAPSGLSVDAEYHFTAEDLERVFVDASQWHEPSAPPLPALGEGREPAAVDTEPTVVVVDENSGVEDITLEGEGISIAALRDEVDLESVPDVDLGSTDELEILRHAPDSAYPEDEEDLARDIELLARPSPAEQVAAPEAPDLSATASAAEAAEPPWQESVPLAAQRWRRPVEDSAPEPGKKTSAWSTLAWTLGSLLLATALAAQLVHYYRQDLVRHPQIGPPLRTAYEHLGLPLMPNWDLAGFELRQWGNEADAAAGGHLVVRASLTNRAEFAQPHPILRLELEDRFGATVATRDFEPAEYLRNPAQASRLLAPGASSEAELPLADPGREAVGYRLDVCLRESASLLRCARGPG